MYYSLYATWSACNPASNPSGALSHTEMYPELTYGSHVGERKLLTWWHRPNSARCPRMNTNSDRPAHERRGCAKKHSPRESCSLCGDTCGEECGEEAVVLLGDAPVSCRQAGRGEVVVASSRGRSGKLVAAASALQDLTSATQRMIAARV